MSSSSTPSGTTTTATTTARGNAETTPLNRLLPELCTGRRRLYICRHGQTDFNLEGRIQGGGYDIPLNDNGKHQAKQLADCLAPFPLDIIASSHLLRSSETADIVMSQQKFAKRISDSAFGEMRFGKWEGVIWRTNHKETAYQQLQQQITTDWDVPYPGSNGESINQVRDRARQGLAMLADHSHVCIVAHGRFNRVLLQMILDDQEVPRQVNACVTVVDCDSNGTWLVRLMNYQGHMSSGAAE